MDKTQLLKFCDNIETIMKDLSKNLDRVLSAARASEESRETYENQKAKTGGAEERSVKSIIGDVLIKSIAAHNNVYIHDQADDYLYAFFAYRNVIDHFIKDMFSTSRAAMDYIKSSVRAY